MNDTHEGKLARIEDRLDRSVAGAIAVSRGGSVAFRSMSDVMEFSKLMSIAQQAVPKHLRGQPGLCLGVIMQAVAWEMEPFAVAKKSYVVNDNLAYESQLIHAVIEARAPLKKRLRCTYSGEGQDRQCTVYGTFVGEDEPHEYTTPKFKDIPVKNSPLWKWDVDQQMFYLGSRAWARKWCPDVLLGVYSPDEAQYTGEDATPVQPIIHNPLQDDADVDERPARDVRGGLAGSIEVGDKVTGGEFGPKDGEGGRIIGKVVDGVYSESGPITDEAWKSLTNHDPETGEVFGAKDMPEAIDNMAGVSGTPSTGLATPVIEEEQTQYFGAMRVNSPKIDPEPPPPAVKPPRQTRRKVQDAPEPAEAPKATPDEKANPAPNPALSIAFGKPKEWITQTGEQYQAYLRQWTEAWEVWGQDPDGLRDRYAAERTIRNALCAPMDEAMLQACKAIATEAFKKLGGVLR